MSDNILTMPMEDAQALLAKRRQARVNAVEEEERERLLRREIELKVRNDNKRKDKVYRALLKAGNKDELFSGFNGDEELWTQVVDTSPHQWIWCSAKYGIIGVPFPGDRTYSFAPGKRFPLFKEYQGFVHKSMNGEVREVASA